jgi:hypothetical protein
MAWQRRTGSADDVPVDLVAERRAPISIACELLVVSHSGYCDWGDPCLRPTEACPDAWLTEQIRETRRRNNNVYQIAKDPRRAADVVRIRVGRKLVERLSRDSDISGLVARKRGRTTIRVPPTSRRRCRPRVPRMAELGRDVALR